MMTLPAIDNICARDPDEPNRTSTTLELLFDLVYVIAVAAAASGLHQRLLAHDFSGFLTIIVVFTVLCIKPTADL
ncbi:low temperature requirement protein A [Psychrobacter sp. 1U2]|uniref:low temperature requirement protein A n=1 Tax=Psychrobacter sp. 1U2 TaxID=3453577 RepID=UPI003F475E5F